MCEFWSALGPHRGSAALRQDLFFHLQQRLTIDMFVRPTSLQRPHVTRWPLCVHLMGYPAVGSVDMVHCVHLVSGPEIVEAVGFHHPSGKAMPALERRQVIRDSQRILIDDRPRLKCLNITSTRRV